MIMTAKSQYRTIARPCPFICLLALLVVSRLPLAPQAFAFAPQDSTHPGWDFPKEEYEDDLYAPIMANGLVYYVSGSGDSLGLRARNFDGDLVFEYEDPMAHLYAREQPRYGVSSDGRVYYFQSTGNAYEARVVILDPDGTRIGTFGPEGGATTP